MGFNYKSQSEDEELNSSKFNEAFLKMHRIHKLQDSIILANFNPTALHNELGVRNYQIILACCNGILKECWGKMSEEERTNVTAKKIAIETFLKMHPVIVEVKNQSNNKKLEKLNQANWEVFEKALFEYDLLMRELLSRTGYDSPNYEDDFDGL